MCYVIFLSRAELLRTLETSGIEIRSLRTGTRYLEIQEGEDVDVLRRSGQELNLPFGKHISTARIWTTIVVRIGLWIVFTFVIVVRGWVRTRTHWCILFWNIYISILFQRHESDIFWIVRVTLVRIWDGWNVWLNLTNWLFSLKCSSTLILTIILS